MTLKQQVVRTVIIWGLLGIFMVVCRPAQLPVVVLIVPFILLFLALMSLGNFFQMAYARFAAPGKAPRLGQKRLRIAVCLSLVLLVVLQSLGQLTLRDAATIAAIAIIGYLYVGRGLFEAKKR